VLNLRLSEIAVWTRGSLRGADASVGAVSTDSRTLARGDLFVALVGERHDGHDHIAEASERGAAAVLVSRRVDTGLPQVVVADTLHALGDLASAVRARRDVTVVGITGSNGKTSVKTLTARILARQGRTHSNPASFNNEIGVPLTLLAMPDDTEYAVLEMGAGKPGDIDTSPRSSGRGSASSTTSVPRISSGCIRWNASPRPRARSTGRCRPTAWP